MELRTIKYFSQLCKDLNFTVAASNLYVTQQALSKAIGNLEKELGVQLFVRGTSGLALTEFGEAFKEEVQPALEAMDRAYKKIQYMKDLNHVRIHFGHVYGIYTPVQLMIEDFCAKYPHIEIVTEEGTDDRCEMDFKDGKHDIICINEPMDPIGSMPIYECPVVLIVAEGGALDCDLTPEMLADGILVNYGSEFNMTKRVQAAFARAKVKLTLKPETADKTAPYLDVRRGKGAILMSEDEAIEFISKYPGMTYKPFPFENDESIWKLSLFYNENSVASEEMHIFVEYLKANLLQYIKKGFHEIYSL